MAHTCTGVNVNMCGWIVGETGSHGEKRRNIRLTDSAHVACIAHPAANEATSLHIRHLAEQNGRQRIHCTAGLHDHIITVTVAVFFFSFFFTSQSSSDNMPNSCALRSQDTIPPRAVCACHIKHGRKGTPFPTSSL